MKTPLLVVLAMTLALGGCGSMSGLNPFSWFGGSEEETLTPAGGFAATTDRRALVPVVTELRVDRVPGGAIITADGTTATQGWWDVELRPVNDERPVDGMLIYEFVAASPRGATRVSTETSRHVSAGVKVSDARLAGVRRIIVRGAQNQRAVSR